MRFFRPTVTTQGGSTDDGRKIRVIGRSHATHQNWNRPRTQSSPSNGSHEACHGKPPLVCIRDRVLPYSLRTTPFSPTCHEFRPWIQILNVGMTLFLR